MFYLAERCKTKSTFAKGFFLSFAVMSNSTFINHKQSSRLAILGVRRWSSVQLKFCLQGTHMISKRQLKDTKSLWNIFLGAITSSFEKPLNSKERWRKLGIGIFNIPEIRTNSKLKIQNHRKFMIGRNLLLKKYSIGSKSYIFSGLGSEYSKLVKSINF